jgi:hypothetical protein
VPGTHPRARDGRAAWIEHAAADACIVNRLLGKTPKGPREHDAREGDYPYTPHDNTSTTYETIRSEADWCLEDTGGGLRARRRAVGGGLTAGQVLVVVSRENSAVGVRQDPGVGGDDPVV